MDEHQVDLEQSRSTWSKLSKKERKKLAKEQKRENQETQKKQASVGRWVLIAVVVIIIALGGFWFFKESTKPLLGTLLPDLGRDHVSQAEWEKFEYNSNPPTSGPHDAEWTKAGVYTKTIGDGHLIHSLEHGYVIVSHNCETQNQKSKIKNQNEGTESAEVEEVEKVGEVDRSCLEFVEKLKERVENDTSKLILVPRSDLDTNFALTAWRRIEKFDIEEANMDRVNTFIKSFRNAGPEQTME
jgi:hypothetical protein